MTSDSDDLDELRKQLKLRKLATEDANKCITKKALWWRVAGLYVIGLAVVFAKLSVQGRLPVHPAHWFVVALLPLAAGVLPFIIGLVAWNNAKTARAAMPWLWFAAFAYLMIVGNMRP